MSVVCFRFMSDCVADLVRTSKDFDNLYAKQKLILYALILNFHDKGVLVTMINSGELSKTLECVFK